ncbi:MAG: class I SAM-dependent methyltransferase [Parvibaculales bacterium]
MNNNRLLFLKQLWHHPQQISALTPSSPALAKCVADAATHNGGDIIELGAGTGNVTHALLKAGIKPEQLHLVEINPDFVDVLKRDVGACHIHHCTAEQIDQLPVSNVEAIISGLPMLSFSEEFQHDVLSHAFNLLKPGGVYIQFTYSFSKPPIRPSIIEQFNLQWKRYARVYRSLPPASVYVFTQPV